MRDEIFDLFVVVVARRELAANLAEALKSRQRGFAGFDLPLHSCRALLLGLREAGGNGLVVRARYRQSTMDVVNARAIAEEELERMKSQTADQYGPLDEGSDQGEWWMFSAENLTEQDRGRIPGVRFIAVDKLNGRVVGPEEQSATLELSAQ
jgi:hypothetical protein